VGIANAVVAALVDEGLPEAEARRRCWMMDSRGLVVASRSGLAPHKRAYAHDHEPVADLATAVEQLRPSGIIGVAGTPGIFTRPVLERMAAHHARPVVFALSNPTSKAECTAEQAYAWTGGRAIFASGSPFAPVRLEGRTFEPGQGNNVYIFPGVGLGAIVCGATRVTDEMFFRAARVLAAEVSDADLERGCVYPPLRRIREVSARIAAAVAEVAHARGLARRPRPPDLLEAVQAAMWKPEYSDYAG
jgi:malate dehydrogenase (oxaloacetate-decarboxylating)(NADP+)